MFFRSLYWAKYSGQWFQQISSSILLQELVKQDKNLAEKLHRNVLRMDNPREKCFQILSEHYPIAERLIAPRLLQQALLNGGLLLARIEINPEQRFVIKLSYGGQNGKEGELAIVMRLLDQDDDLARLSFSFISQGDIYIGGLQGFPGPNSREIVSQASKACSGLSPKRMVMEAMFALATQVGASAILGVPDEQHISRIKVNKYFSYNDYWNEFKAARNGNGDYVLPLAPTHKDLTEVPTKRRAKYRRQHDLLDAIRKETLNTLGQSNPIQSNPIQSNIAYQQKLVLCQAQKATESLSVLNSNHNAKIVSLGRF
jgi:uncharacterized protein VirK/YbjX